MGCLFGQPLLYLEQLETMIGFKRKPQLGTETCESGSETESMSFVRREQETGPRRALEDLTVPAMLTLSQSKEEGPMSSQTNH